MSQLFSNAFLKFNSSKLIKAVVKPQPGHSNPNIVFHKQGIQISISEVAFRIEENRK
jgi:hypothetical protein